LETYQTGLDIYGVKFITGEIKQQRSIQLASGALTSVYPELFFIIPEVDVAKVLSMSISGGKYATKLMPLTKALKYADINLGKEGITFGLKVKSKEIGLGNFTLGVSDITDPSLKVGYKVSEYFKVNMDNNGKASIGGTLLDLKFKSSSDGTFSIATQIYGFDTKITYKGDQTFNVSISPTVKYTSHE